MQDVTTQPSGAPAVANELSHTGATGRTRRRLWSGLADAWRYQRWVWWWALGLALASGGLLGALLLILLLQPDLLHTPLALIALFVLTVTMLTALFLVSHIVRARRVQRLTTVVRRLAAGEAGVRNWNVGADDLGQLQRAVNLLADRTERHEQRRSRERDRFDTVLHAMSDGVLMLDRRGFVLSMNPAAAHLLRIPEARALQKSFVQVVRDYRVADAWQLCLQTGAAQTATVEVNPGFYLRVSVTPFLNDAGSGYAVLLQDLSHLYRLETVRRDFVSNISHELRTPLASMKALVDTLRDGAIADPPAAERFLGRMEVEVDSMTQMVQELLELSRIESGQAPLRLFPTGVGVLVEPAVERLRPQAERVNLTLAVVLPSELPQVMVDADRIRQVVINLVHNAIKFTPPGGFVTVTARCVHDSVVISVADTGIGIPAADVPRIFERFYKADRARSGGGTGLGLAIAKHTIQAHNGRIWVESVEGQGSTFSFTLPLVNLPLTK